VKVIVDIGHPAHVHFFKHFIWEMKKRGHEILITASKKEITLDLLEKLGFDYIFTCKRYGSVKFGYELIKRDFQMFNLARKFKPDVITGIHNTIAAHVSKLTKAKSIIFTDTEHAKLANLVTFPFADVILTPSCFKKDIGKKQIRYNGYHELAYLYPNYFTPNPAVLERVMILDIVV
jgi:predicted glycosyltransferase